MKLDVTGVETIEITDPKGLCSLDAEAHTFLEDPMSSGHQWKREVTPPGTMMKWPEEKWGLGLPQTAEPAIWAENWQSTLSPDKLQEAFEHGYRGKDGN